MTEEELKAMNVVPAEIKGRIVWIPIEVDGQHYFRHKVYDPFVETNPVSIDEPISKELAIVLKEYADHLRKTQ